jgi:hypothetical protein
MKSTDYETSSYVTQVTLRTQMTPKYICVTRIEAAGGGTVYLILSRVIFKSEIIPCQLAKRTSTGNMVIRANLRKHPNH